MDTFINRSVKEKDGWKLAIEVVKNKSHTES